jgi:hypothetical protein
MPDLCGCAVLAAAVVLRVLAVAMLRVLADDVLCYPSYCYAFVHVSVVAVKLLHMLMSML